MAKSKVTGIMQHTFRMRRYLYLKILEEAEDKNLSVNQVVLKIIENHFKEERKKK